MKLPENENFKCAYIRNKIWRQSCLTNIASVLAIGWISGDTAKKTLFI